MLLYTIKIFESPNGIVVVQVVSYSWEIFAGLFRDSFMMSITYPKGLNTKDHVYTYVYMHTYKDVLT